MYTMEYYSAVKQNEILPYATTWMDLGGILLSEISQAKKDKNHLYVEPKNQNKGTNKTKQKQTHRYREQTGSCQRGGELGNG